MPLAPFVTRSFVVAAAGNFLFFTGLAGFLLLPLHLKELGATERQLGFVMGCYSGTAIFLQPVVGVWVDRGSRRALLVAGALLTGGVALLFAAAPDAILLFPLWRALQGVAYSVYFVANFALLVDLVPAAHRGQALGVFGISGLLSTAIGPGLGELIVRRAGFRGFFLAAAGISFLGALVARYVSEPRRERGPAAGSVLALARGFWSAAATPRLPRLPMVLGAAFGLGTGTLFTFIPTYGASLGVERVGVFAGAYSVAALAVRAFGGQLVDTLGRRAVIIPALVSQAAATGVLAGLGWLTPGLGWPAAPFVALSGLLAGAAHGFLYPALTALVVDRTPAPRRGQVVGVFGASILTGNTGGAIGGGAVADVLGHAAMFLVVTLALAWACLLARRLER